MCIITYMLKLNCMIFFIYTGISLASGLFFLEQIAVWDNNSPLLMQESN